MQLYILFEKSNNSCVLIDFWALYWTETAARDGIHECHAADRSLVSTPQLLLLAR